MAKTPNICPTCGQLLPQKRGKRICADCGKPIYLGSAPTAEGAHKIYQRGERVHFGEFAGGEDAVCA